MQTLLTARRQAGFSMIELLITLAIIAVITMGMASILSNLYSMRRDLRNKIDVLETRTLILQTIDCAATGAHLQGAPANPRCKKNEAIDVYRRSTARPILIEKIGASTLGPMALRATCSNVAGATAEKGFQVDIEYRRDTASVWIPLVAPDEPPFVCRP